MKEKINLINYIRVLTIIIIFIMLARPAYSIPTTIDELKQSFGEFCSDLGIDFCSEKSDVKKNKKKERKFTESEKNILTKLSEQKELLRLRSIELDRREKQLKMFQDDIQRQVSQLEKLQKKIEENIDYKKTQDNEQLTKAVALYSKMDSEVAAKSLAKLDRKIAVEILKQMKEKQASQILSNMAADDSASMIEEITKKK
tara:strand:+ start:1480 stop:2079 length:600 start_codon:yes stop_codon:yes gene_type:complete